MESKLILPNEKHKQFIDDAWLNIGEVDESKLFNPIEYIYDYCQKNEFDIYTALGWVVSRPEYFSFVCKHIMNIQVSPTQALLIHDMWGRKRPMLVGSRGLGKAQTLDSKLLTDHGWIRMGDVKIGDRVFSKNGKLCNVVGVHPQGRKEVYRVHVQKAKSKSCTIIECSGDHLWEIFGGRNKVVKTRELYRKSIKGKKFHIPKISPIKHSDKDLPEDPYYVGLDLNKGRTAERVPEVYFTGSVDQRKAFLRGFLLNKVWYKTDKSKSEIKIPIIQVSTKELAQDIVRMFDSLGIYCGISKVNTNCGSIYCKTLGARVSVEEYHLKPERWSFGKFFPEESGGTEIHSEPPIFHKRNTIVKIERTGKKKEMQCITVDDPSGTYVTDDYIVTHNSFILSLYSMLRAFLLPERQIVVVGRGLRQSKFLFDYCSKIWNNAPVLRDLCSEKSGPKVSTDRCLMRLNDSSVVFLPLGDGEKIRGQRGHDIIADEFSTIPVDIFERVIKGFAAVSSNPIDNVRRRAAQKKALELGYNFEYNDNSEYNRDNQVIVSGTAFYEFHHFGAYWKRYKEIIESCKDSEKIKELFKQENMAGIRPEDYAIYRIPVDLIPDGFMEDGTISDARATTHSGIYEMEYGAVFSADSKGFFKRSLIESCTCQEGQQILSPSQEPIFFSPAMRGSPHKEYIIGVDPASEVDNFSIVVIELNEDHRRVVYCWTTTNKRHKIALKAGHTQIDDFYCYCARKIRELMKKFNTVQIAMDPGGGGVAVMEALHAKKNLEENEQPIWPVINPEKKSHTDDEYGLHIVRLCPFASAQWMAEANHGLRKDMEDKLLIFPFFDFLSLEIAEMEDNEEERIHDTLQDCMYEIEQIRNELSIINIYVFPNGRERWDTPGAGGQVESRNRTLRKDRYSALLMANDAARRMNNQVPSISYPTDYIDGLGFAGQIEVSDGYAGQKAYNGPAWFDIPSDLYD